jgi:hypothetical protein
MPRATTGPSAAAAGSEGIAEARRRARGGGAGSSRRARDGGPELVKLGDFEEPVYVASPPRGSQVFVVERRGVIKTLGGDTFLDISPQVTFTNERGLLSMAFAPDYVTSGLFYTLYTAARNPTGEDPHRPVQALGDRSEQG